MPLLDIQSAPSIKHWPGMESVTVVDYMDS
eukprot:SAG22_NODE_20963_length_261_cov_0.635802_1_plen_29_part_01